MIFTLGLFLGIVLAIFIAQNFIPVTVTFLAWEIDSNLGFILLLAILAGMLITWLWSLPDIFRISSLEKHAERLEADLNTHKQKLVETETKLAVTETPIIIEKTTIVNPTETI